MAPFTFHRVAAVVACIALCSSFGRAQTTGTISVEMLDHFKQTNSSAPTSSGLTLPYSFEVHVNSNNVVSMTGWNPVFSTPTGATSYATNTNTGTDNFVQALGSSPNSASSYFFQANFSTASAMTGIYSNSGTYTISFPGVSGSPYSAGLTFSGGTYSVATPMITGTLPNGASWASSQLKLSTSGTTTLTINSGAFTEYGSSTYGASIQVGLANQSGTLVSGSSTYWVPGLKQEAAMTSISIDGSSLAAGQTYTLAIQYGILAGTPVAADLNSTSFQGAAWYFNHTDIQVLAFTPVPEPSEVAAWLGVATLGFVALRRRRTRA